MKRAVSFFHSTKKHFFLKKHRLADSTLALLKDVYPSIDWTRVDFYEGLPWFTPYLAPFVTAQALPQFYSFSRYSIYIRTMDESRAQCLADIVHEGYHILQAMHFSKGYGIGFFRGLMVYYIAFYTKYGYRQNPFEIPAFEQEYRFLDYCEKHYIHGIEPKVPYNAFKHVTEEPSLIFRDYPFQYKESNWRLLVSCLFCALVTLIKPLADAAVFIIGIFFQKKKSQDG
jgi:hypothetical protein